MPDFKHVDATDFGDVERVTNSQLVDRELKELGGGGYEGAGFFWIQFVATWALAT